MPDRISFVSLSSRMLIHADFICLIKDSKGFDRMKVITDYGQLYLIQPDRIIMCECNMKNPDYCLNIQTSKLSEYG
jgi:hypothetical protein